MADYTQLKYIESTGTQYIDTGIAGDNDNLTVSIKYNLLKFETHRGFFGNYVAEDTNCWRFLQSATDGDPFVHYISVNTAAKGGTISVSLKKNVINTLVINKDASVVNGVTHTQSDKAKGNANNSNLMLFTQRADGESRVTMQLYSFSIADGGTIVRDFVPCRTADDKIGLWDKMENKFYANAGAGTFVPGPDIIEPVAPSFSYLYNGVKLPAPPLGFTGHLLLVNDAETNQYVMCYGLFYRYPADTQPIVYPRGNIPTCYASKEGMTNWVEITTTPDGDAGWYSICDTNEYVWTNQDIYWLDSETASGPTAEVAYAGTAAQIVPDDPEPEPEPEPAKDSRTVSRMMGYMVGQAIRK